MVHRQGQGRWVYKGRPASINAAQVHEMKSQGLGPTEIAKALGIGRATVYRVSEPGRWYQIWPGNRASFVGCGRDETIDALERYQRIGRASKLEPA